MAKKEYYFNDQRPEMSGNGKVWMFNIRIETGDMGINPTAAVAFGDTRDEAMYRAQCIVKAFNEQQP